MILYIIHITTGILLIGTILLQMQGSGLSGAFGGSSEIYRSKRSFEKFLMWATGFLIGIFTILSILLLLKR